MLKRIISAAVMLIVLVPILIAGGRAFYLAVGIIALLALKEILDLKKSHSRIPSGVTLMAMAALIFLVFYEYNVDIFSYGLNHLFFALILILFLIPTLFSYKNGEYITKDAFYLIGVIILLGTAFNAIIVFRNMNLYYLVYLFLVTIMTDTFALVFGMLFGHHPLAPLISPKKTIEGAIGGLVMGSIIPSLFYYNFISPIPFYIIFIISLLLSFVSQLGDLLFSKIKRENEIKDFSNLIPGHGGILDRFDSIIFVVLAYVLLIQFI